ncbi:MAG: DoxX family membrane protein [Gammaproteobacteria bacterium]|nr:DoxX family membrane protein [Gammaproteobacteria bacterium]MDD9895822.1 DoxX family membrane protein [Gammaproteobacteria bacterium]MDD9958962.1 DoxX family membrane protein [Gammaproteobacteria bacterium]
MLDPVIQLLLSLGFSLLFIVAGVHKLSNRLRFQGIIEAYQVLPKSWTPLIVITIGLIESVLGIAWLTGNSVLIPLTSAVLLSIYVVVISINLYRGRTYIDCGCGFSAFAGKTEVDSGIQQLSFGLVLRNFLLIALAIIAILPSTERVLGAVDYFGIVVGLLTVLLIYAAANQLLSNHNAIGAWRNVSG